MSVLSNAILSTIQGNSHLSSTLNPTSKYYTIYYYGNTKVITANTNYAFVNNSSNSDPNSQKINLVNIKDKKNKNLTNLLNKIVIKKGEQVTIYTKAKIFPEIITNP